MKNIQLNKIKGFTLVELLVVVAIIAILSVIGLTIFTSAQTNARDARRKSDIDAIAAALEASRTPATVYFLSLLNTAFSAGVVPTDSANAYCIRTTTSTAAGGVTGGVPSTATGGSWASGNCPSTAAIFSGTNVVESAWLALPSGGVPANLAAQQVTTTTGQTTVSSCSTTAGTVSTVSATCQFGYQVVGWKVCAKLESKDSSSNPIVYCKANAQ